MPAASSPTNPHLPSPTRVYGRLTERFTRDRHRGHRNLVSTCLLAGAILAGSPDPLRAWNEKNGVRVRFVDPSGERRSVEGELLVEAVDGGVLVLARDGQIWNVTPKKQEAIDRLKAPVSRLNAAEMAQTLRDEVGPQFQIIETRHYVIATSADPAYANWCGRLFERLLEAFLSHWKSQGIELSDPKWPLTALIFADEREFKRHAAADAGKLGETSQGYYSLRTNRIMLYDLTASPGRTKATSVSEVKRRTATAAFNVATIVHEATHQIAFNAGMHTRFADNPMWLTEGMAMFFETPDLDGDSGWKTLGQINVMRFERFLDFLRKRRKRDSLATLVSQPRRFLDSRTGVDAYAEAWALTYFLQARHADEYAHYLRSIARKSVLIGDKPSTRRSEFETFFGHDLAALDREFVQFMKALPRSK